MRKITIIISFLSFVVSSSQIARNITFEQPIWPDASSGQTEIVPATYTDGIYQFTASEKIFINGNAASDGSQSFWPTNFTDGESFTIETLDGSEFSLVSVQFLVFTTDAGILNAEGFKDGASRGIQTSGVGFGTSIGPEETKNVIFDSSIFDSVDRVVITSTSSGFGWALNLFDEFIFSEETLSSRDQSISNSVVIYPNPAKNFIKINNKGSLENISVYDILGKLVLKSNIANNEIDISNLKSGIYLFKIETSTGVFTKKVIKE